jgi:hypothetical protein
MVIGGYYNINGYWWLLMAHVLMVIDDYSINDYWKLVRYPFVLSLGNIACEL